MVDSPFHLALIPSLEANTKKLMSHFRGFNNLVTIMFIFFFFLLLLILGAPAEAGLQNPLVELSSREDLVQVAGYGEEKLSTVLISGMVLCEACSDEKAQTNPKTVSGALVAVSCHSKGKTSKSNWVEGTTDEFGDFLIDLPSHLHAIPNLDKRCLVRVLRLPKNSFCYPTFTGKQTGLKLSSVGNGIRTYAADSIYLTHKPPQGCINRGDGEEKDALVKTY